MEEKLKNKKGNHEDSFNIFMFGDRGLQSKGNNEKGDPLEKTEDHSDDLQKNFTGDDWIIGKRNRDLDHESKQKESPQLDEFLNQVNVDELMNNIDDLITSISHIKPLWKKVGPFVNKWMKP